MAHAKNILISFSSSIVCRFHCLAICTLSETLTLLRFPARNNTCCVCEFRTIFLPLSDMYLKYHSSSEPFLVYYCQCDKCISEKRGNIYMTYMQFNVKHVYILRNLILSLLCLLVE